MPDVLLFDLDGTLTNPRVGIVRSIRYALDALDCACPDDDALASFIGPSLRGTFGTLLATVDRDRIEQAMTLYRERYADVGLFENEVYDGVPEMLDAACAVTPHTFVVTAKPTVYASRIVERFALGRHFRQVYGVPLDERLDDKARLLAHVLATEDISAKDAVMIGDRANDVLAARNNGVRSIGVLWGFGSERELRDAGVDRLCGTPADLVGCLR